MAGKAIDPAARLGDGFLSTQNHHQEAFLEAWQRHGRDLDDARIMAGQWAVVAEDQEKVWAEIGACAVYQLNAYNQWGAFGNHNDLHRFQTPADVLHGVAHRLTHSDPPLQ